MRTIQLNVGLGGKTCKVESSNTDRGYVGLAGLSLQMIQHLTCIICLFC